MKWYSVTHLQQVVQVKDGLDGKRFLLKFGKHAVAIATPRGITRVQFVRDVDDPDNGKILGDVAPQLTLHISKLLFGQGAAK